MLDATVEPAVARDQQDVGHAADFAPTPSGCRHTRRWFVVASYPKAERRAHDALHLKGFTPYLPLITLRRPDRSYVTTPLFQGYLFVNLDPNKPWYTIRYAPGVFCLLTVEEKPAPCPRGVVEAIQAGDEMRSMPPTRERSLRPGDACSVAHGAFAGHRGVVLRVTSQRAVVAMLVLSALREVTLPLDCLVPAT